MTASRASRRARLARLRRREPTAIEAAYGAALRAVVLAEVRAASRAIRSGASPSEALAAARRAGRAELDGIDLGALAVRIDRHARREVAAQFERLGGDPRRVADARAAGPRKKTAPGPVYKPDAWIKKNVQLITRVREDTRARIAEVLEKNRGARHEDISRALVEVAGIAERKAELVARDQVLTLNAQRTEAEHKAAGIVEYDWLTAGDGERVREWHRDLDGTRQRYDDPPVGGGTGPEDPGNPGSGINCRCQAIPVLP